ncbi:hypothetical protein V8D89_014334 [Ganoderma adspersum]
MYGLKMDAHLEQEGNRVDGVDLKLDTRWSRSFAELLVTVFSVEALEGGVSSSPNEHCLLASTHSDPRYYRPANLGAPDGLGVWCCPRLAPPARHRIPLSLSRLLEEVYVTYDGMGGNDNYDPRISAEFASQRLSTPDFGVFCTFREEAISFSCEEGTLEAYNQYDREPFCEERHTIDHKVVGFIEDSCQWHGTKDREQEVETRYKDFADLRKMREGLSGTEGPPGSALIWETTEHVLWRRGQRPGVSGSAQSAEGRETVRVFSGSNVERRAKINGMKSLLSFTAVGVLRSQTAHVILISWNLRKQSRKRLREYFVSGPTTSQVEKLLALFIKSGLSYVETALAQDQSVSTTPHVSKFALDTAADGYYDGESFL